MKKEVYILRFLFIIFILAWIVADIAGNFNDDFKYVFLLIIDIYITLILIKRNNLKYKKELKKMIFLILFFSIISIIIQIVNWNFKFLFLKECFYIFFPFYTFWGIFNIDDNKNKNFYMDILFYALIIIFIFNFSKLLSFSILRSISFSDSYSPFESSYAAAFLVAYTYYFIKKKKIKTIIAAILCILSFKRLDVIYVLIFPILYYIFKLYNNNMVNKKIVNLTKLFFIMAPYFLLFLISDDFSNFFIEKFGITLNKFTSGRFEIINYVLSHKYNNYGLGTITDYIVKEVTLPFDNMHCDLLRIYLETTILGNIVYTNSMFSLVKNNKISFIVMIFFFLIMFTSHMITMFFMWFILYCLIFDSISYKEEQSEK